MLWTKLWSFVKQKPYWIQRQLCLITDAELGPFRSTMFLFQNSIVAIVCGAAGPNISEGQYMLTTSSASCLPACHLPHGAARSSPQHSWCCSQFTSPEQAKLSHSTLKEPYFTPLTRLAKAKASLIFKAGWVSLTLPLQQTVNCYRLIPF